MISLELGAALRAAQLAPESVPDVVLRASLELAASDVVVYLVDFAQTTLEPMPDRSPHAEVPEPEPVAGSMAGRAFTEGAPVITRRPGGDRVWAPIIEGSDRTGVLALTVPATDASVLRACEDLGLLTGYLLAAHARTTDLYNLHRRRRSLTLAASMQWDLLPPLVLKTRWVSVAGTLEPAYEVGGDCFDYTLNSTTLNVAICDTMGHGVASALIAALAMGAYRHHRREAQTLEVMHAGIDDAIAAHVADYGFATGQLAQIDVEDGSMTWTNAGHPLPLLLRGGRVIGELHCPATPPWGLGSVFAERPAPPTGRDSLEPGDAVLFYTDGVIEAHAPGGEEFGLERLADLAGQHTSDQLEPEEIVRQIVRSVLDHQSNPLVDDATLLLVRWNGPPD